ncbi:hypothetical protein N6L27_10400 [Leisingera sp. SS27]|uniref:hypothetical protein n=1 Tax=Leisingera sp. SS27 TaxID=2979462 RepID=UPI0023311131|nr:hypothetical protein [Leisingera sp. SS27]MDC0658406.1 hypothetical protein [Leisingera sp. SS27]
MAYQLNNAQFRICSFVRGQNTKRGSIAAVLSLALLTATSAAAITTPVQGVLNFEPGTSIDDVQARIETEICKGASSVTITSGPEQSLDPTKEQVTFQCEP